MQFFLKSYQTNCSSETFIKILAVYNLLQFIDLTLIYDDLNSNKLVPFALRDMKDSNRVGEMVVLTTNYCSMESHSKLTC